jgi:hypothetical protein
MLLSVDRAHFDQFPGARLAARAAARVAGATLFETNNRRRLAWGLAALLAWS